MSKAYLRIIFDTLILATMIFWYWWVAVVLSIVGLFLYKRYYEILIFALILDSIFSTKNQAIFGLPYPFLIFAVIILIASFFIKKNIVFYRD